ncbi:outer membrane protein assembly factor BamE [Paenibacillus sp. IITD108]|uniref:outer membrane protein assembly factor BamE n=1 Tax=Paenibacillus sp. IITD108 TaxID=3116649 RepID=UPI002F3F186C
MIELIIRRLNGYDSQMNHRGGKMKNTWLAFFGLYCILYILLYLVYLIFIKLLHSSYSIVSVTAIILPFLFLLLFHFALWKASENDFRSSRKGKNIFTGILIIGSILPLCCGVILGINEYRSNFTIEKWLNNQHSRVYIVDNLLKKYDFEQMTKDEVTKLLGTPPETNYFKGEDNIVYYLGDERGLISIDSEWLIFEFDENENVKSYEVRSD